MPKKQPQRDPLGKYQRKATSARRVGAESQCACGEKRPEALIAGSNPTICADCERKKLGRKTFDDHHVPGKRNSPVTIPVPVNDHRAELSVAQLDWLKETRENPEGSPLLAAAAGTRGFADTNVYLVEKLLLPNAEMLECLDAYLEKKFGPKWWLNTELEQFAPKR